MLQILLILDTECKIWVFNMSRNKKGIENMSKKDTMTMK